VPQPMPPLSTKFRAAVAKALALAYAAELTMTSSPSGSPIRKQWHVVRVELLYELAYLKLFIEWEWFLEQSLLRYMCGCVSHCYSPIAAAALGAFCSSIASATKTVLVGRSYALWHNPKLVSDRARQWLSNCPHETVIISQKSTLENFAAVRHRIAHGQSDAKAKFDSATMALAGRRYRGSSAGRFLRDWDTSTSPQVRQLETLGNALAGLAGQIA
jgi:hypothetical protein